MVANHLTTVGSGSGEWQTPGPLFQMLDRRWLFNYDAFASHANALCKTYATQHGVFLQPRAFGSYQDLAALGPTRISDLDGLDFPWKGRRVFGNPPFSRGLIDQCIDKFVSEAELPIGQGPDCAVFIVPCAPDTAWYQRLATVCDMEALPKRPRFIHPPFECGDKCQTGKVPHELGRPLKSPPGPMTIATARVSADHWRAVL